MKHVILGLALATLALPLTAPAQGTGAVQAREKAMKDCLEKHGGLMDKPAVKNPRDCWRAHGYLSGVKS